MISASVHCIRFPRAVLFLQFDRWRSMRILLLYNCGALRRRDVGVILKPLLTVVFATTADNMEDQPIVCS